MTSSISVSIIVPAYRAAKFIYKNLKDLKAVLDKSNVRYEIVCVVDGSIDQTEKEARRFAKSDSNNIKVFAYTKNRGKGYAVRYGFDRAQGDLIGFIDAGVELNPKDLGGLLGLIRAGGLDIVIASKRHPNSKVVYPLQRKIVSVGYQIIIRNVFGINVKDTQAGMKIYTRKVYQAIRPYLKVEGFAFDIEMLAFAKKLGFGKIVEAPITLTMHGKGLSTIPFKGGFVKNSWKVLVETWDVFVRLKKLA